MYKRLKPALWLLVALVGLSALTAWRGRSRLNVVVVSFDVLSAKRMSLFGHPIESDPFIRRHADGCASFTRNLADSSLTAFSHFSTFTGIFSLAHKYYRADGSLSKLPDSFPSMIQSFSAAGYRTGWIGFGNEFDLQESSIYSRHLDFRSMNKFSRATLPLVAEFLTGPREKPFALFLFNNELHEPFVPALESLRRLPGSPQALKLAEGFLAEGFQFNSGKAREHLQWNILNGNFDKGQTWGKFKLDDPAHREAIELLYAARMLEIDRLFQDLLELLRSSGLERNTLLVLNSDHGAAFGEHGQYTHVTLHNTILHTPLLFCFPGGAHAGRLEPLTHSVDIYPTLMELIGAPLPREVQGRSLVPLIRGGSAAPRKLYFSDQGARAVLKDGYKLILNYWGAPELYRIDDDFYESSNLADKLPQKLRELELEIQAFEAAGR